jgi:hypothetical protein
MNMTPRPSAGFWLALLAMIFFVGACDEGGGALPDAGDDIVAEADVEDDPNPPCPYPEGPYAFAAMGDVTPMMYWPETGIAGTDETVEANLGKIRCLDGVNSIFFFIYGQS